MAHFNAIQMGHLIRAFYQGGTAEQIADRTGFDINTVYRYIRQWHPLKVVFIQTWKKSHLTGRLVAVWELRTCDGQHDAPRLPRKSSSQRTRDYLQRKAERMAREMFQDMKAAA